jgi:hypothetical protein
MTEGDFLAKRRAELTSRAEQRGIDWKAKLDGADMDDDGFLVAALASLLGVDIQRVFDPESALDRLERESARIELEKEIRDELAYGSALEGAGFVAHRLPPERR